MIPVIAIVGRPNVGKSTLFNRLTRSKDALVADYAGLTRDRKYGEAVFQERRVMLVDTGGLTGQEEGIDAAMAEQSLLAVQEADAVLFMLDCRDGLTPVDEQIAAQLRQYNKKIFVGPTKLTASATMWSPHRFTNWASAKYLVWPPPRARHQ